MVGAAAAARFAAMVVAAALVAAVTAGPVNTTPPHPQYDDNCMMCVCRASGRNGECLTDEKCTHLDTFGPFCISLPYWIDAGKPVLPGDDKDLPGAFQRCVEEPFCAVKTVRGYMDTGPALQDCDHDGTITCRDLMFTHLHGRYNCKETKDARVDLLMRCLNTTTPQPNSTTTTTTSSSSRDLTPPAPTTPRPWRNPPPLGGFLPRGRSPHPASPYTDGILLPDGHMSPDDLVREDDGMMPNQAGRFGELPGYAPKDAFHSLFGEDGTEGPAFPGDSHRPDGFDFSREMKDKINEHIQRMRENAHGYPHRYPQPNGGGFGGYHSRS